VDFISLRCGTCSVRGRRNCSVADIVYCAATLVLKLQPYTSFVYWLNFRYSSAKGHLRYLSYQNPKNDCSLVLITWNFISKSMCLSWSHPGLEVKYPWPIWFVFNFRFQRNYIRWTSSFTYFPTEGYFNIHWRYAGKWFESQESYIFKLEKVVHGTPVQGVMLFPQLTFVCFFLAQQPTLGQGLLIHEVSRSHPTTHYSR